MSEDFRFYSDEEEAKFNRIGILVLPELLFDRLSFEVSNNIMVDLLRSPEMPPSEEVFKEVWDVFIPFVKKLSRLQFRDIDEPIIQKREKARYQARFSKIYKDFCSWHEDIRLK